MFTRVVYETEKETDRKDGVLKELKEKCALIDGCHVLEERISNRRHA